jgi:hypothetical protein
VRQWPSHSIQSRRSVGTALEAGRTALLSCRGGRAVTQSAANRCDPSGIEIEVQDP